MSPLLRTTEKFAASADKTKTAARTLSAAPAPTGGSSPITSLATPGGLTGVMSINGGASFTPTTAVTLHSSVAGATRLRVGGTLPWKAQAVLSHALGIRTDGTLWSWGSGSGGRLGTGSTTDTTMPVQVMPGTSTWTTVAAGSSFSVALRADGSMWTWGVNSAGQLGNGTTNPTSTPAQVNSGDVWRAIAAGSGAYVMAIRTDGTLWGWGQNSAGQLGIGTTSTVQSTKVQVQPGTTWRQAAVGYDHTVAIRSDGTLWAWGSNQKGQLGRGNTTPSLVPVQIGTDSNWVSVAAGDWCTFGVKSDGTMWACGYGGMGQLGINVAPDIQSTLAQCNGGAVYKSVAAGLYNGAAIRTDGSLATWGYNQYGTTGTGGGAYVTRPTSVSGGGNDWQHVAVGFFNILALRGTVEDLHDSYAAGMNSSGVLGDGTKTNASTFTPQYPGSTWQTYAPSVPATLPVPDGVKSVTVWYTDEAANYTSISDDILLGSAQFSLNDGAANVNSTTVSLDSTTTVAQDMKVVPPFRQVATSQSHSAGIATDGTLWTWGDNNRGQLGLGYDGGSSPSPVQVGTDTWRSVAAGLNFTVGVKTNGELWAWGDNGWYQLARTGIGSSNTPLRVGTASNWTTVTAGYTFAAALDSSGYAWAWGNNQWYQVSTTGGIAISSPTPTGGGLVYEQLVCGTDYAMGLTPSGNVMVWGLSGAANQAALPGPAKHIAGASYSRLAILDDGRMYAWGGNGQYQLGLGDTTNRATPTQVGTESDWVTAGLSGSHGLAIDSGGELWGWGSNAYGNVGDGTTATAPTPGRIGSETDWTAVSVSDWHSLALKGDIIYGWGYNGAGLLGNCGRGGPIVPTTSGTGWVPYAQSLPFSVDVGADGTVTVPVYFRTSGGYLYGASDSAYIDAWPPAGTMTIDGGASQTSTTSVTIGIGVTGATRMRISGGAWQAVPTSSSVPATLTPGDGTKTLVVDFADDSGNTITLSDTIELDATPPEGSIALNAGAEVTRFRRVEVSADVTGASFMQVPAGGWSTVSGGHSLMLGVRDDGTLWSWGWGGNGQLGTGNGMQLSPLQVGVESDWTTVSAGAWHATALKSDGSLWTWGMGTYGSLGTGGSADKTAPYRLMPGTAFRTVSAGGGGGHNLAIRSDGTLWAWGPNSYGQIGNAGTATQWSPVQIGTSTWKAVAAGSRMSYGIRTDGSLYAWGDNSAGQLGDGTTSPRTSPTFISAGPWDAVGAGETHAAAIKSDGTLWVWGQAGDGVNPKSPTQVPGSWLWAAAGNQFTVARKLDGSMWSWGVDNYGQLGNGSLGASTVPQQISPLGWVSGDASLFYAGALDAAGRFWVWGVNNYYTHGTGVGDGGSTSPRMGDWRSYAPTWTVTLTAGAGEKTVEALYKDGSENVASFTGTITLDASAPGLLIDGGSAATSSTVMEYDSAVPGAVQMLLGQPVVGPLASGYDFAGDGRGFTILPLRDGPLVVSGMNDYGQRGDGTTIPYGSNSTLATMSADHDWAKLSAGAWHVLAVKNDGSLWAWGDARWSQLGDGTTNASAVPKRIGTGTWLDVAAGETFSGGVRSDGTLWKWGQHSSTTPTQVGGDTDWASVYAGIKSYYAIKRDGRLYSWSADGYNYYNDLGLNWATPTTPTLVSAGWASISPGKYYVLGIKTDGSLWGWGKNDFYQLGDGTQSRRDVPTVIDSGRWRSVSAAYNHSTAIAADGSAWTWGENGRGQLGDGTTSTRTRPSRMGTRYDWTAIDAGPYYTLGTTADGTVWGWGTNFFGQLGPTAPQNYTSPVVIRAAAYQPYAPAATKAVSWASHDTTLWAAYRDAIGNVEWLSDSISLDTWAPATTIVSPGGWASDTVEVGLDPRDGDSGVASSWYALDGGAFQAYSGTFTVSAEGTTLVSCYSVDVAGNREATKSANVRIDRTPPVTTSDAASGEWNRWLTLSAEDTMAGPGPTFYRVDGGLQMLYTGPMPMTEGIHTVEFWSEDAVGNAEPPNSVVYRADLTAPTSTVSGAPVGWTNADVDVTLAGSDAFSGLAGIRYRVDGSDPATYGGLPIQLTDEGTHTIESWAVDVSGLAEETHTTHVRIDKTLPSTVSDYDGSWRPGPVRVSLTASDPVTGSGIVTETTYKVGAEATATYTGPFDVSAEGTTTVVFTSRDAGGNQEPARTVQVRVDTTEPHTWVSTPPSAGGGAVSISLATSDTGSGIGATRYRVAGGPVRPYTASTRAIVVTSTGSTLVEFWSVDNVGNVEATESVTVSREGVAGTGHGGNAACLTCHDTVRGMVPARVDYAVPDVDLTKCAACHWIGVHPGHAASTDCVACHRTFPAREDYYSPKVTTAYGAFTSAGSPTLPAATIHQIHADGSWPQTATAEPASCASCHAPASCDACHIGDVQHREHASASQPATYPPVTYQAARGTPVGDTSSDYTEAYTSTCSSVRCHDLSASHVAVGLGQYEESGPAVTRTGSWTLSAKYNASGGYMLSSTLAGSSLTYTFAGSGEVRLFGSKSSRGGLLAVSIDGGAPVEVDTYSPMTTYRDLLLTSTVASGTHTLTATVTGRWNPPSLGSSIALDTLHAVTRTPSATDFVPGCEGCHADKVGTHGYGSMDHVADETATVGPETDGTACGVCHSMELMAEHEKGTSVSRGRSCLNCHPSPRMSLGPWAQTCEQGGCHSTGGPEQRHRRLPAVHVVSEGGRASCSRNCHSADIVAEHERVAVSCADCHTSARFAAVFDTPAGWNGTCQACHDAAGLKHGTSSSNGWCVTCHGTSDATMTAVAGTSAYNDTAGDHETGYDGSAHSAANVPAGADGGVDTDSQCEACHNHSAVREGVRTDYRVDGGAAGQDAREGLCFRCHSASGDETRSPGVRPYTWNGRDVATEFARRSAHPLTVSEPALTTVDETLTAFVQSAPEELDTGTKFQMASLSTTGATLAWDTYEVGGGNRSLLFYLQNRYYGDRKLSQFDPGIPFSFGWNSGGLVPAGIAGGLPEAIERASSVAVVDNTLVWGVGSGTPARMRYTPPADGSSGPGVWSSDVTSLPFTPSANVDTAEDPGNGLVYYIGSTGGGSVVYKWRTADDTWTPSIDARSGAGALNISTNSGITYSPETDRLYLAVKNPSALGRVYYTPAPAAAEGQTQFTDTGLALNDTAGVYSGYAYTDLQCFSRNGHDYLFYTGSYNGSQAMNSVRMSVIGGLADGTHAARTIPDWTWYSGSSADVQLAWDGGDYMYAHVANQVLGRIRIPDDPIEDPWEPWEQLPPAPRVSVYDDDPGVIAMLNVPMPSQTATGYRTLGTLSAEVRPPAGITGWGSLTIDKSEPALTMVRIRIEGWDGSAWQPIPGLSSLSAPSVDLSAVDPGAFTSLRLTATLTTSDTNATPKLRAWTVTATRGTPTEPARSLTCVNCHNAHIAAKGDGDAWDLSRVSDPANTKNAFTGSTTEFCITCHSASIRPLERVADGLVPYAVSFGAPPAGSLFPGWTKDIGGLAFTESGHARTSGTKALCENCHDPHGSDNARLTAWTKPASWTTGTASVRDNSTSAAGEQALCLQCHGDGTIGKTAPGAPNAAGAVTGTYGHSPAATGRHADTETLAALGAANRHAECVDCHDPHVAQPGTHQQGLSMPGPAIRGAWGVKPIWPSSAMSTPESLEPIRLTGAVTDTEAYLCLKCHTASAQPAVATRSNGTTYAPTDIAAEFNPANASYHNVLGLPGGPKQGWTFDGVTIVWPFPQGVFQPGWDMNSRVTCTDCHTSAGAGFARGPHGSSVKWMIDPAYPVDWETGRLDFSKPNGMTPGIICNKCHKIFDGDNGAPHGADGIATPNIHQVYSYSCTGCHIRIPHGWKRPRLIAYASDPPPYRGDPAITRGASITNISLRTHNDRFNHPYWMSTDCGTTGCSGYGHSANAYAPLLP